MNQEPYWLLREYKLNKAIFKKDNLKTFAHESNIQFLKSLRTSLCSVSFVDILIKPKLMFKPFSCPTQYLVKSIHTIDLYVYFKLNHSEK